MERLGMNQHQLKSGWAVANIESDSRDDALRAAGKNLFWPANHCGWIMRWIYRIRWYRSSSYKDPEGGWSDSDKEARPVPVTCCPGKYVGDVSRLPRESRQGRPCISHGPL